MQSKQLRLWQKVVRGAHDSIKPGVKRSGTPGSRHEPIKRARGVGDSPLQKPSSHLERSFNGGRPLRGLNDLMCGLILGFSRQVGIHPRLYADVRSAHSCLRREPAERAIALAKSLHRQGCYSRDMPDSYTNLLYHFVFSTKDRRPLITPDYEVRLYDYIGGTVLQSPRSAPRRP